MTNKVTIPNSELKTLRNTTLIAFCSKQPNDGFLATAGMGRLTQKLIHSIIHFIGQAEIVRKPATLP